MATPMRGEYVKNGMGEINLIAETGAGQFFEFVKIRLVKRLPYPPGYALFFRRKYNFSLLKK